jgi:hypothetical protein
MSKITLAEQRPLAEHAVKPHSLVQYKRATNNVVWFTDTFGNEYVMHWRTVVLMRTQAKRIRITLGADGRTATTLDVVNKWLDRWGSRCRLRGRGVHHPTGMHAKDVRSVHRTFQFIEIWWPLFVKHGKLLEKWMPYEEPFMIEATGLPADARDAGERDTHDRATQDAELGRGTDSG